MDAISTEAHRASLRAAMDGELAAKRWALCAYPTNGLANHDRRVEELIRAALHGGDEPGAYPPDERLWGQSYLLVTGTQVRLDPAVKPADQADTTALDAVVRSVATVGVKCDRCRSLAAPVVAWLPVPAPPQIVALALCGGCVAALDRAVKPLHFIFAHPTPDYPED